MQNEVEVSHPESAVASLPPGGFRPLGSRLPPLNTEDRIQRTEYRRQNTEDRRQNTEDRIQKTEERRQKTEGRIRKAEYGRQKTEGRRMKL
jgi:hypothetical protein